jgi:hypothetical protein
LDKDRRRDRADRLSIGVIMLLIAGSALGFWLVLDQMRLPPDQVREVGPPWLLAAIFVLGGFSLLGVPLLLWTARRKSWGAGRFLWFTSGTAAWLLWPPVVYHRVAGTGAPGQNSMSGLCFFYGTPLMAVYVTFALLAKGAFRRSQRRRLRRSQQELFGLLLGLLWACMGLYLIGLFYFTDFSKP